MGGNGYFWLFAEVINCTNSVAAIPCYYLRCSSYFSNVSPRRMKDLATKGITCSSHFIRQWLGDSSFVTPQTGSVYLQLSSTSELNPSSLHIFLTLCPIWAALCVNVMSMLNTTESSCGKCLWLLKVTNHVYYF